MRAAQATLVLAVAGLLVADPGRALASGPASGEAAATEPPAPAAAPSDGAAPRAAASSPPEADAPSSGASASEPPESSEAEERPFRPGLLPGVLAVVPGLLVHGAGHFAAGDTDTAVKLVELGAASLVAGGLGLGIIGATGASRQVIGPAYALTLAGIGVFTLTGLADIYGAAFGGRAASPLASTPLEVRAGYTYVYDPLFAYRSFAAADAIADTGALIIRPSALAALDADNQRWRLALTIPLLERRVPEQRGRARTWLGGDTALTFHRFGDDGFSVLTIEAAVSGRMELGELGRSLRGAFGTMALGVGMQLYDYAAAEGGLGEDAFTLLLMRFGFGAYVGPAKRPGEVELYYDHRHDDLAAGLGSGTGGDGVPGHFGLRAAYPVSDRWALDLDAQAGAAYVISLAARYRLGAPR